MTQRELDSIVDPATCARRADARSVHSRLGEQKTECGVNIARPCLLYDLLLFGEWSLAVAPSTALAKTTIVHRYRMKPARRKQLRKICPGFAIAVAHMQQHDAGSGFRAGKIRRL